MMTQTPYQQFGSKQYQCNQQNQYQSKYFSKFYQQPNKAVVRLRQSPVIPQDGSLQVFDHYYRDPYRNFEDVHQNFFETLGSNRSIRPSEISRIPGWENERQETINKLKTHENLQLENQIDRRRMKVKTRSEDIGEGLTAVEPVVCRLSVETQSEKRGKNDSFVDEALVTTFDEDDLAQSENIKRCSSQNLIGARTIYQETLRKKNLYLNINKEKIKAEQSANPKFGNFSQYYSHRDDLQQASINEVQVRMRQLQRNNKIATESQITNNLSSLNESELEKLKTSIKVQQLNTSTERPRIKISIRQQNEDGTFVPKQMDIVRNPPAKVFKQEQLFSTQKIIQEEKGQKILHNVSPKKPLEQRLQELDSDQIWKLVSSPKRFKSPQKPTYQKTNNAHISGQKQQSPNHFQYQYSESKVVESIVSNNDKLVLQQQQGFIALSVSEKNSRSPMCRRVRNPKPMHKKQVLQLLGKTEVQVLFELVNKIPKLSFEDLILNRSRLLELSNFNQLLLEQQSKVEAQIIDQTQPESESIDLSYQPEIQIEQAAPIPLQIPVERDSVNQLINMRSSDISKEINQNSDAKQRLSDANRNPQPTRQSESMIVSTDLKAKQELPNRPETVIETESAKLGKAKIDSIPTQTSTQVKPGEQTFQTTGNVGSPKTSVSQREDLTAAKITEAANPNFGEKNSIAPKVEKQVSEKAETKSEANQLAAFMVSEEKQPAGTIAKSKADTNKQFAMDSQPGAKLVHTAGKVVDQAPKIKELVSAKPVDTVLSQSIHSQNISISEDSESSQTAKKVFSRHGEQEPAFPTQLSLPVRESSLKIVSTLEDLD